MLPKYCVHIPFSLGAMFPTDWLSKNVMTFFFFFLTILNFSRVLKTEDNNFSKNCEDSELSTLY